MPVRLIDGTPVELVVGDDVQQAQSQQSLAELRLELKVANMTDAEGIAIRVNGTSVAPENIERLDANTFQAHLTAPPLRRGINQLVFLPGPHSAGQISSEITTLQLSLRYKQSP